MEYISRSEKIKKERAQKRRLRWKKGLTILLRLTGLALLKVIVQKLVEYVSQRLTD